MLLNEESIMPFLDQASVLGLAVDIKLDPNLAFPSFSRPKSGYAIWRWGEITPGERAVQTLVYDDADGADVLLTLIVGRDGFLREVEAWRGDGASIQSLGATADMKVVT